MESSNPDLKEKDKKYTMPEVDELPFNKNDSVPIDILQSVIDNDTEQKKKHTDKIDSLKKSKRPAISDNDEEPEVDDPDEEAPDEDDGDDPYGDPYPVNTSPINGMIDEIKDSISAINSNIASLELKYDSLEKTLKNSDSNKQLASFETAFNNLQHEVKASITVFDKDFIKNIIDQIDLKMKILHEEGKNRQKALDDLAETIAAKQTKWILIYSGLLSMIWTAIVATALIFIR